MSLASTLSRLRVTGGSPLGGIPKVAHNLPILNERGELDPSFIDGQDFLLDNLRLTGGLVVDGDFTVRGTQTVIHTSDLLVKDNFITINDGAVDVPSFAGIHVDRGPAALDTSLTWVDPDYPGNNGDTGWGAIVDGVFDSFVFSSELGNYVTVASDQLIDGKKEFRQTLTVTDSPTNKSTLTSSSLTTTSLDAASGIGPNYVMVAASDRSNTLTSTNLRRQVGGANYEIEFPTATGTLLLDDGDGSKLTGVLAEEAKELKDGDFTFYKDIADDRWRTTKGIHAHGGVQAEAIHVANDLQLLSVTRYPNNSILKTGASSAAVTVAAPGTDYLTPTGDGSQLTNVLAVEAKILKDGEGASIVKDSSSGNWVLNGRFVTDHITTHNTTGVNALQFNNSNRNPTNSIVKVGADRLAVEAIPGTDYTIPTGNYPDMEVGRSNEANTAVQLENAGTKFTKDPYFEGWLVSDPYSVDEAAARVSPYGFYISEIGGGNTYVNSNGVSIVSWNGLEQSETSPSGVHLYSREEWTMYGRTTIQIANPNLSSYYTVRLPSKTGTILLDTDLPNVAVQKLSSPLSSIQWDSVTSRWSIMDATTENGFITPAGHLSIKTIDAEALTAIVKHRYETESDLDNIVLLEGEIAVTSDTHLLRLGDGLTAGGVPFSGMLQWVNPPTTTTSSGVKDQIAYDSNYLYICVDTNNWKRTSLSSW